MSYYGHRQCVIFHESLVQNKLELSFRLVFLLTFTLCPFSEGDLHFSQDYYS